MPIERIQPDENVRFRYLAPPRAREVRVRIEADGPVDVHALTPQGMRSFDNAEDRFEEYTGARGRRNSELRFQPDPGRPWFLLIINYSDREDVAVHYEVEW